MSYKNLWLFLEVLKKTLIQFYCSKELTFEPYSTGIQDKETVYMLGVYGETAYIPIMYKEIILQAPSLTIYVICTHFCNYQIILS